MKRIWGVGSFLLLFAACGDDKTAADPGPDPDPVPPPTVSAPVAAQAFTAVVDGNDVLLNWTEATNVVLVRQPGNPTASLTNGTTYAMGDTTPGPGTIVAVLENGQNYTDTNVPPGPWSYAVFGRSEDMYAAPARASVLLERPLSGTISIDKATGAVTVTNPPPFLTITGTAELTLPEATLTLTATNNYGRLVNNLKAVVTNISEGEVTPDATYDGSPAIYYGANSILNGESRDATVSLTGLISDTAPITLDIDFLDHPTAVWSDGFANRCERLDASGSQLGDRVDMQALTYIGEDGDSGCRPGAFSPDGRYLYAGSPNQPAITVLDMATGVATHAVDLTGQANIQTNGTGSVGFSSPPLMSRDGKTLYAAVTENAHQATAPFWVDSDGTGSIGRAIANLTDSRAGKPTGKIVKVDRETLTITGSVTLFSNEEDEHARVRVMTMTPDSSRAAVASMGTGTVFVVDLANMTVLKEIDVSSGPGRFCEDAAISPDGNTVYLACKGAGHTSALSAEASGTANIHVIDVETGVLTGTLEPPTTTDTEDFYSVTGLRFGPDEKLYLGIKDSGTDADGITVYDTAIGEFTDLDNESVSGFTFGSLGRLLVADRDDFRQYQGIEEVLFPATGEKETSAAPGQRRVQHQHSIGLSPF